MPRRLCVARSPTPVARRASGLNQPGRKSVHDSVTRHPFVVVSNAYLHSETFTGPALTRNENLRAGSASMTVATVFQDFLPTRFVARNLAPGLAGVALPSHSPPSFSGDHSPIRVTSATIDHNWSGAAEISLLTLTDSDTNWNLMVRTAR